MNDECTRVSSRSSTRHGLFASAAEGGPMNAGPVCIAAASGVGSCGGIAEVYVTGCGRRRNGERGGVSIRRLGAEKINQIVRRFQGTVAGSEQGGGSSDVGLRAGGGGLARASPRAGALEGRCTHVKLRTPLFRRPHAAEKLSQPSSVPPRRFRRRGRDGRSPERLRRCPRDDGPVRRRRRHLRDDARGGVRRHRRRIEPAAVPARRARTDDPSRARAARVLVSRPHRPPDFCRGSWGPRGGRT